MKKSIQIIVNYTTCKKFYRAYKYGIRTHTYRFALLNLSSSIKCHSCYFIRYYEESSAPVYCYKCNSKGELTLP